LSFVGLLAILLLEEESKKLSRYLLPEQLIFQVIKGVSMINAAAVSHFEIVCTEQTTAPWQEVPDRQLVEFCLQGLEEAWIELLRRYSHLISGVLIKTVPAYLRQASTLPDLFQEVLAKICANSLRVLREFEWRHEGSLRGLLQVISANVANDYLRRWLNQRRDMRREFPLDELKYGGKAYNSHSATEQKILLEQLARCLAQRTCHKPNHIRDIAIFLLYYHYGLPSSDLARIYQLNIKTVETKLTRLKRLARIHCAKK
jgi:DNA-directed RNA polymerase specialized sigma24 family protein